MVLEYGGQSLLQAYHDRKRGSMVRAMANEDKPHHPSMTHAPPHAPPLETQNKTSSGISRNISARIASFWSSDKPSADIPADGLDSTLLGQQRQSSRQRANSFGT